MSTLRFGTDSRLRRVLPNDGAAISLESPEARSTLLEWYQPHAPEYVRLNLIASLDGRAAGPDGTSDTLTSRTDRTILGVIRELSDVVLVGAESVRREGYLRPRRSALAIVTASGDLRGHRLTETDTDLTTTTETERSIIVITTDQGAKTAREHLPNAQILVLTDQPLIPATAIIDTLRRHGLARIAVEGGPRLAAHLLRADVIDELCLTVMPRIGGPPLSLLTSDSLRVHTATPVQLLVADDGTQFGRWRLQSPSAA